MCCEDKTIKGNFTYVAFASDAFGADFNLSRTANAITRNYMAIYVSDIQLDNSAIEFPNYFYGRWAFIDRFAPTENGQVRINVTEDGNSLQSDELKGATFSGIMSQDGGIKMHNVTLNSTTGTITGFDVYAGEAYLIFYTKQ